MLKYSLSQVAELRILEESDAEPLYWLMDRNRAHLRRWLPFVDATQSPSDTLAFIQAARRQFADNQGTHFGIHVNGNLGGVIGFHYVDWANRSTSIGYWLGEEYQGHGLMTSALRALVDYSFIVWKLNRVEIRVATENLRSQAVPQRLGFRQEGVLRQREWLYDHFVDHIVYSMLASEWK